MESKETDISLILPHGGVLKNRFCEREKIAEFLGKPDVPEINLDDWTVCDAEMIGCGGFSPLEGFMDEKNYLSVINSMRLTDGTVWSMPVVLPVEDPSIFKNKEKAILVYKKRPLGIIEISDIFKRRKEEECMKVFKTTDPSHPAVRYIKECPDYLVGGNIYFLKPERRKFRKYYLYPDETREEFKKRKWKTVVGFQTRNPIHRAHEYIQKCALEICDGLFIHPIIGSTKSDDIPAEVRMKCYEVLIKNYFPRDRVMLCVNPSAMRYGGPREAILHAIVRKNYGCTHFIVGRDHAGVGNFYGPYDAQRIFEEFKESEIGIKPLFFENSFYCKKCASMATEKTCPHGDKFRISISGTKTRELLSKGKLPPPEFTRKEIAEVLIGFYREK
jgi:sulfate adenylyltransferase